MILRNFEMWFTSMDEMFCSSVEEEDVEGRIFHRILFGLNFLNVSHFLNIMLKWYLLNIEHVIKRTSKSPLKKMM